MQTYIFLYKYTYMFQSKEIILRHRQKFKQRCVYVHKQVVSTFAKSQIFIFLGGLAKTRTE